MSLTLSIMLTGMCIHLNRKTKRDPLTKLLNKEQFERNKNKHYIVIIDIDKFKQINDTLGHPVGDCVLKSVAKTIKQNLKYFDKAYRIGGDEFAVITKNPIAFIASIDQQIETPVSIGYGLSYEEADHNMYLRKSK